MRGVAEFVATGLILLALGLSIGVAAWGLFGDILLPFWWPQ